MGLCALCTCISCHSSHFFRFVDLLSCHHHRQRFLHIRGLWGGGEKKTTYGSECKTAFGRLLKPTIYIYTDMHILSSVYVVMCSSCLFPLYIFPFFFLVALRKRNQSETPIFTQLTYVILQNKGIKDQHQHSTEFRYIFCISKSPQTSTGFQLNQGFKYREVYEAYCMSPLKLSPPGKKNIQQSTAAHLQVPLQLRKEKKKKDNRNLSDSDCERTRYVITGRLAWVMEFLRNR